MVKYTTTIKCSLVCSILLFFALPISVFASAITLEPSTQSLGVGDEFTVQVVLANESESINAVSGDIVFDDTTLSAERVLSANSIIPVWIDAPAISGNAVTFSGIIPEDMNQLRIRSPKIQYQEYS